jgi:hypothetical protein
MKCINASIPLPSDIDDLDAKAKIWPPAPNGFYKLLFTVWDASDDNIFSIMLHFEYQYHMNVWKF